MNKAIKVLLINLAAVFGITLLMSLAFGNTNAADFLIGLGLVSLGVACLDLLVSLILFIAGQANYPIAKGFLLSSAVLFVTGFTACSFTTLNFH
ncbi:MAG: hypothetical protein WAT20_04325 [Ferruginibacter sp.]